MKSKWPAPVLTVSAALLSTLASFNAQAQHGDGARGYLALKATLDYRTLPVDRMEVTSSLAPQAIPAFNLCNQYSASGAGCPDLNAKTKLNRRQISECAAASSESQDPSKAPLSAAGKYLDAALSVEQEKAQNNYIWMPASTELPEDKVDSVFLAAFLDNCRGSIGNRPEPYYQGVNGSKWTLLTNVPVYVLSEHKAGADIGADFGPAYRDQRGRIWTAVLGGGTYEQNKAQCETVTYTDRHGNTRRGRMPRPRDYQEITRAMTGAQGKVDPNWAVLPGLVANPFQGTGPYGFDSYAKFAASPNYFADSPELEGMTAGFDPLLTRVTSGESTAIPHANRCIIDGPASAPKDAI